MGDEHPLSSLFKCDICCKGFDNTKRLFRHIQSVHENMKRNKCPSCHLFCATKYNLRAHIKSYHAIFEEVSVELLDGKMDVKMM